MSESYVEVPAGWYPDPLGLPQLRWWDSQAWTEHTAERRTFDESATAASAVPEPVASIPAPPGFADLPSRRETRERERLATGAVAVIEPEESVESDDDWNARPLLTMTLRELEPPTSAVAAPTETPDTDAAPGPRRASSHANSSPETPLLSALAEELEPGPSSAVAAPVAPAPVARTAAPAPGPPSAAAPELRPAAAADGEASGAAFTGPMWVIALMPVLQLVTSILLIVGGLGHNLALLVVVWVGPVFLVIGLAAVDVLLLRLRGVERPAPAAWALIGSVGYLVARAVRLPGSGGRGIVPVAVTVASGVTVLAGILIVPGVLLSLFPGAFAAEAAASIEADAAALGLSLTVECPTPPLAIGETVACIGTAPDGAWDSISVRLVRQSGWIDWRVEDWGPALSGLR